MNAQATIHRARKTAIESPGGVDKNSILMVGTFLSSKLKHRGMCEELAERLKDIGWSVLTTSNKLGRLSRLFDMVMTVRRQRSHYMIAHVDVFSGPAFIWAEATCWALQRAGKPYVLTLHGGDLPTFSEQWPRRVRRLLRSAMIVTTPSRYLLEKMSPYRRDLLLIPNPIETNDYEFRLRVAVEPQLIWLRAFSDIYNPSLAPEVLSQLRTEFPGARLTMVGHDKGDGSLQQTWQVASELHVSQRLTIKEGVPKAEVPAWLNKGDIFINTTNVDNTPVSVLEAMSCGLCIVSTNVGGIPYLLTHEVNALLVPPDDPKAMAGAVRRVLTEPGLAERLSLNAHKCARQFDWLVVLPRWENLLTSFANEHVEAVA